MDPSDLKPNADGKYRAYYLGQLIEVYPSHAGLLPNIMTSPGNISSVEWDKLSEFRQLPVKITKFTIEPLIVFCGENVTMTWQTEGAYEVNMQSDYTYLKFAENGQYTTNVAKLYNDYSGRFSANGELELKVILSARGYGYNERAEQKITVVKPGPGTEKGSQAKPHVCPDHPTVEDATYHAREIERDIELFLIELRKDKENQTK